MSLYGDPLSSAGVTGSVHSLLGKTMLQKHLMRKELHEHGKLGTATPPPALKKKSIYIFWNKHLQNAWVGEATVFSGG